MSHRWAASPPVVVVPTHYWAKAGGKFWSYQKSDPVEKEEEEEEEEEACGSRRWNIVCLESLSPRPRNCFKYGFVPQDKAGRVSYESNPVLIQNLLIHFNLFFHVVVAKYLTQQASLFSYTCLIRDSQDFVVSVVRLQVSALVPLSSVQPRPCTESSVVLSLSYAL